MTRIFISYRRDDSQTITGRIYDRLIKDFDPKDVFKDVDAIPPGADFPTVLRGAVQSCQIQLVIIGPQWAKITDSRGRKRLSNPDDFVRQEVEMALQRPDVTVIPVLVRGAEMPSAEKLPSDLLKKLCDRNAARVRDDPDFHGDMDRLIKQLKQISKHDEKPVQLRNILIVAVLLVAIVIMTAIISNLASQPAQTTPLSAAAHTPTLLPLELARTPVAQNADWTPVIEDFNGVEMVVVPAGCFMMGSEDGDSDERPVHEVCFEEPFWIDRYEVTNEQFARFGGQAGRDSFFVGDDRPREQVTWDEAQAFCELRGARLPTEAEWEYAARGPDGRDYPWGNEFDCSMGNFDDETHRNPDVIPGGAGCDGFDVTAPAGSFPQGASWVGASDLSGNVWEWVADLYGAYTAEVPTDSGGTDNGDLRILRGGSWVFSAQTSLRAAYRLEYLPTSAYDNDGFRCARDAE